MNLATHLLALSSGEQKAGRWQCVLHLHVQVNIEHRKRRAQEVMFMGGYIRVLCPTCLVTHDVFVLLVLPIVEGSLHGTQGVSGPVAVLVMTRSEAEGHRESKI